MMQPHWNLPDEYAAIPLDATGTPGSLRICVIVRREAEPIGGHFISIANHLDARTVLGCLGDADGNIHQWLEISIQDADRMVESLSASRRVLNNKILDERWKRQSIAENNPPYGPLLTCGWEQNHPPPLLLDLKNSRPITPTDMTSGEIWQLCEDDAALSGAGLEPYSSSLHRYLWLPNQAEESTFLPVTANAPTNERCVTPESAIKDYAELEPLNLGGGLLRVREFLPIRYEAFNDVLSGEAWKGVRHGRIDIDLGQNLEKLNTVTDDHKLGDGWLFQGHHGRWGRLVETLHLKLRALSNAFESVRETVRRTQTPLLNLEAESFNIRMGEFGSGLPFLWSAKTVLTNPGEAVALPIESSEIQYFLQPDSESSSIYQQASAISRTRGHAMVRIRELIADSETESIVAGTLVTQERLEFARNDLLWLRMELKKGHFDLFVHLDESEAMAGGEWRFRTISQHFSEDVRDMLKEATGVPISDVRFEMLPLLSTPYDLYALAVLGVRTLLVDKDNSLPIALDEVMSLARQVAIEHEESVSLRDRIDTIFQRDPRWGEVIGPHRITHRPLTPEEALDLIPSELWYDTLGMLVRLFPGVGADSICRDFADAPIGGIHRIFDPAIHDLGGLLLRTRSLIVIDWRYNREINAIIRRFATGHEGAMLVS